MSVDVQVPEIGALMGYKGTRIKGVCYVTGTEIVVPRTREADTPVSIDIYANDEASLQKAQQMIDECFAEVRRTAP